MSIDVSQFVQAFLDESFEGLDLMENELLREEELDLERVNAIFRAAHSIKGSAGTFGFGAISDFTHGVETLLDQVRDGSRRLTADGRSLLLESVDRIRDMLVAAREGTSHDGEALALTRERIDAMLASREGMDTAGTPDTASPGGASPSTPSADPSARDDTDGPSCGDGRRHWVIEFRPHANLLRTGNDPLRIFAYLSELGTLQVECDVTALPALADLTPESSHLAWRLGLTGEVSEAQVREAFEWVEDDCDLSVSDASATAPLQDPATDTRAGEAPDDTATAAAAPESATPAGLAHAGRTTASPTGGGFQTGAAGDGERRSNPQGDRRADSASIRVAVDKVDTLVNMVGELVITQAMLTTIGDSDDELDVYKVAQLREGLKLLERNTRELQEAVLSVRMLPINFVFSRFPRMVRDLSQALGKQVTLKVTGEETELDKGVIEKLVDPLTHIVRNSIDHGIEAPDRRRTAGKPETGTLHIRASHQGGNIVIEVTDDGAGLNRERILAKARERNISVPEHPTDRDVWQLIFAPGFSTAEAITDVSGRGVGMDVVRRNIESINGRLDIESSEGHGTKITIRLPLTLAILDGMSVRVGEEVFILPLTAILESMKPEPDQLHNVNGRGQVVRLRGDYLPLVPLHSVFNLPARHQNPEDGIVVVVESANDRAALFVDELIAQHQVVIKSLETNYRKVPGVSGATIMGDGRVALILDVDSLTSLH